jgi:hypothetical protein
LAIRPENESPIKPEKHSFQWNQTCVKSGIIGKMHMVTFSNPDIRTIKLTQKEQLALLQYCVNIPSDIHQMLFSAVDGLLTLTPEQCSHLRRIVESEIDRISNPETADTLIGVSHKLITNPIFHKIAEQIGRKNFNTIEEMQVYANIVMDKHNNSPDPVLGGLTPHQTFHLINLEWDNSDFPIKFRDNLGYEDVKDAPLFHNAAVLIQELLRRKNENTATAAGNLSRKAVSAVLDAFKIKGETVKAVLAVSKTVNEYDVTPVWTTRIVCQQAGLVRKNKNKFAVTKKAVELLRPENSGRLYHLLFITYFRKFNIGFYDRLPDLNGLQHTIGYTIYHLNRLAKNEVSFDGVYRKIILPAVLKELEACETEYIKTNWIIKHRVIEPLEYAGLLNCKREKVKLLPEIVSLKISPLYEKFVQFEM